MQFFCLEQIKVLQNLLAAFSRNTLKLFYFALAQKADRHTDMPSTDPFTPSAGSQIRGH